MKEVVKNNSIKGVILVSFEFPPRRLSIVSEVVSKHADYLNKKGIKTWVVTFDDWRSDIETEKNRATVIRIPNHIPNNISIFSTVMNLKVAYQSAIAAIINQERIDLIHFFEWQTIPLLIPWGDILKVQKVYSTTSIQRTRNLSKSPLASGIEKLEELSLNKSDLILASSEKLSKLINENYDVKAENLEVLSFEDEKYSVKTIEFYQNLLKNSIIKA